MQEDAFSSVGGYVQTSMGRRNAIGAIVFLMLGLFYFEQGPLGMGFLLFVFVALCATALFANLWAEAIICLLSGILIWSFVVIPLWWNIEYLFFIPAVASIGYIVFAIGFLFADVLFSETQPQFLEWILLPGRKVRHRLIPVLPLRIQERVPAFFRGQIQRSRFDISFEKTTELYAAVETPKQEAEVEMPKQENATETQRTTRPVMSAPIAGSGLYVYTFILELVGALARSIVTAILATIALFPIYILILAISSNEYYQGNIARTFDGGAWLRDNTLLSMTISLLIGFGFGFWPIVASLFHIVVPVTRSGSGPLERDTLGAREPTRDEMTKIIDTIQHIQATSGQTIKKGAPSEWLVLDEPFPDSYTIGSTVYLTRAAIESDYLPGIMAHEMGHVAHKDGDLLLSLRRFIVPLAYWVGIDRQATAAGAILGTGKTAQMKADQTEDEKIFYRFQALKIKLWLAFWFGGLGLLLLGRSWARFWRNRDFLADNYAVFIGQEDNLISALEVYRHVDVAQPYLLTNRPYTAERLDRLKG